MVRSLREAEAAQVAAFVRRWLTGEAVTRAELRELRARYAWSPEACDLLAVVALRLTPAEG